MLILAVLHFHFVMGTLPEDKLKDNHRLVGKAVVPHNPLRPSP